MFQSIRKLQRVSRIIERHLESNHARSVCAAPSIFNEGHRQQTASTFLPVSSLHSPFRTTKRFKHKFVPRKAAVKLTDKARKFFKQLLANPPRPDIVGILLNHQQSDSGEPRMVFAFKFVAESDLDRNLDEGVSLELIDEHDPATGSVVQVPKPPKISANDKLPKLYVHRDAFLKVLGATVDVDTDTISPVLYNREGDLMDPNA